MAASEPISLLEMLYPLLQGYDSVAVEADVELGGPTRSSTSCSGGTSSAPTGSPQQAIMTMPILVGVDGTRKMSKSLGNQIGILDPPQEMYGKTMAIPDSAMGEYYRLLLGREPPAGIEEGAGAARDAKRELARELVAWLHSDAGGAGGRSPLRAGVRAKRESRGDGGGRSSAAATARSTCPR